MERVRTILQQLQHQLDEKSSAKDMLVNAKMLQAALLAIDPQPIEAPDGVFVMVPLPAEAPVIAQEKHELPPMDIEEKVLEVLQVNEKELEEELEAIKKNAEA